MSHWNDIISCSGVGGVVKIMQIKEIWRTERVKRLSTVLDYLATDSLPEGVFLCTVFNWACSVMN